MSRKNNSRLRFHNLSKRKQLETPGHSGSLQYETLEPRQLLASNILSTSPDGQWIGLDPVVLNSVVGTQLQKFNSFSLYDLQEKTMGKSLALAPLEFTNNAFNNSVSISIPRPDKSYSRFSIVEAPVMEPALAAQFPEIKTYRGFGVDDPSSSIRFDITPHGFHAQVLSPKGDFYVDPIFKANTDYYASYFVSDAIYTGGEFHESDLDESSIELMGPFARPTPSKDGSGWIAPDQGPSFSPAMFGTQLRTFRVAVAATGEYTAFHGGTVLLGQAAIVTAINRVTGVYEKDLAIRMVLVANNSSVVYTNSATDPYTNGNGGTMLGQNQTNLDAVIGNANYDIGHVFSTGGGGVAGLGVVGVTGQKARGVTGSGSPVGDSFWIDYVAHEMGHQFGGSHTFNSSTSSCGGGNRSGTSAYEPGSGSTIQAYAGICGTDDLQPNSDAMFHSRSIDQMRAYIATIPLVGTTTNTGNAEPTVNAGLDYVIPTRTPFELTAVGSDPDSGNVLSYSWEQRDLGVTTTLGTADNGQSPIFRTWNPTTDSTRVFPRLSNLVNNTVPVGEKLPTVNWNSSVSGNMDFRVVVRDNATGGGGVNWDDMNIQVVSVGATGFSVTSQNSGGSWTGNSSQAVTWDVAGTTASPINAVNVDVWLSTDGGFTYPTLLLGATPNDGTQSITVPNISTNQARIKVKATGNIFFDINNANITITPVTTPTVNIAGPAGLIPEGDTGTSQATFVLTLSQAPTSPVSVNYASSSSGFANPATAGSDYTAVSGTANFAIGQTTMNLPVTIFGDRFTEGIEQFKLTLSSPSGLLLGTSTVDGSISDDDAFALGKPIDFGTATSPVQAGATGFSVDAYRSVVGIGWTASSDMIPFQLTFGTDMTRDLVLNTTGNFRIDIPNGTYSVDAIFGIVDFNGERANYPTSLANFTIIVEGVPHVLSLAAGSMVTQTFSATVIDGALDIGLDSVIARRRSRLSGLVVNSASSRGGNGSGGPQFQMLLNSGNESEQPSNRLVPPAAYLLRDSGETGFSGSLNSQAINGVVSGGSRTASTFPVSELASDNDSGQVPIIGDMVSNNRNIDAPAEFNDFHAKRAGMCFGLTAWNAGVDRCFAGFYLNPEFLG